MAREYHRKSCKLSRGTKRQVEGILMDYDRLRLERLDILHASAAAQGMPRGHDVGVPTEQRAFKLSYIETRLQAVDQSAVQMRAWLDTKISYEFDALRAYWNYHYFNFQHLRCGEEDLGPSYRTWNRYRDRFAEMIAEKLNFF